jgi:predicted aminopeptidase
MMAARTPCQELIENPKTSTELKTRLLQAGQLCDFAGRELGLEAGRHYQHYADLGRPYVVWNVYAAPEFSVQPKTWRYPYVGRLEYRGYFRESDARRYAARMAEKGWEVHVEGASAYSTLGWFHDPLLNTFLWAEEADLAETIFHELAHQRLFIPGDSDFNEAFATMVGREGARRWLQSQGDVKALEAWEHASEREERYVALALAARGKLEQLYAGLAVQNAEPARPDLVRDQKRVILEEMCRQQRALWAKDSREASGGSIRAGSWNNARLNAMATYYELVPAFQTLFAAQRHDLAAFYKAVERMADLDPEQRLATLLATKPRQLAAE